MRHLSIAYLIIFTISSILTIFIVYNDVDHPLATATVVGYAIFLIASFICLLFVILWRVRKLPRKELQKRGIRFLFYFAIFFAFSFLINLSDPDYYKSISIALGVSFGMSFVDLAFPFNKEAN